MIMYVRTRQTWTIKRICIECMAHTYLSLLRLFHCWDKEDRLNDLLVRIKSQQDRMKRICKCMAHTYLTLVPPPLVLLFLFCVRMSGPRACVWHGVVCNRCYSVSPGRSSGWQRIKYDNERYSLFLDVPPHL